MSMPSSTVPSAPAALEQVMYITLLCGVYLFILCVYSKRSLFFLYFDMRKKSCRMGICPQKFKNYLVPCSSSDSWSSGWSSLSSISSLSSSSFSLSSSSTVLSSDDSDDEAPEIRNRPAKKCNVRMGNQQTEEEQRAEINIFIPLYLLNLIGQLALLYKYHVKSFFLD